MADAPETTSKGEVKLPGLGKVSKKTLAIVGVVAGGVLAYVYFRHARNSAASSAAGGSSTDTSGDIDPATGYPYGSAQDQAALAAQQDSNTQDTGLSTDAGDIDPETGYPYGSIQDEQALQDLGLGTGTGTGTGTGGGGGSTTSGGGSGVTTNAQWEQECIANLEAGGVAQSTVTAAESGLPRYLAKLSLSSAQATAVQMCVGLTGPPPVGGPYNIVPAPPAPPKPGATKVTVPAVTGMDLEDARKAIAAKGLKSTIGKTFKGTTIITSASPKAGTSVAKGSTVHLTGKAK